jgi:L-lactate utilization protein LutB
MADGAYQGDPDAIIPYRKPCADGELEAWQEALNTVHRSVRARVEHVLAQMKNWKILRDHRRKARTLHHAAAGIAYLHNLAATG